MLRSLNSEADSLLVVGWLSRVRLGSILGLIVAMCYATFPVLGMFGVVLGRLGQNVAICAIHIAGAAGVWLLVSPEPRNWKWLWLPRWILRLAAVVLIISCAASVLIFGIFRPFPETSQADGRWTMLTLAITMSLWFCLYLYLRRLAQRLGDSILRKSFSVLMWIAAVVTVLALVIFVSSEMNSWVNAEAPADTPSKANEKTVTIAGRIVGNLVYILFYAWTGWLMWRLSRQLRSVAERLAIQDGTAREKPII